MKISPLAAAAGALLPLAQQPKNQIARTREPSPPRAYTPGSFQERSDIFRLRMHSSSFESKRFDHRGSISCLALKRTHGRPHESCRHILRVDVFHTVSAVWYKPTPKPTLHTLPLSLSWMLGIGGHPSTPCSHATSHTSHYFTASSLHLWRSNGHRLRVFQRY